MRIHELQDQMMREFKTTREVIYDETKKQSDYADMVAEKAAADTAYLAMMMDIELEDEEEEEEPEEEVTENE